ncbi:LacI family DNA-binding transcriptional regulator [Streptomyces aculeolatus]
MPEKKASGRDKRPTMSDVAAAAGVSLKTVSRVVNNVSTVDPQLRASVLEAIRELGFRRNDIAATLAGGGTTAIVGLVTEDLANAFYSTLASVASGVARERGYQLISASSEEDPELERQTALDLCRRRVEGLLIVPAGEDQSYLQAEVEVGIPMVFIDRPPTGLSADTVLIDNRSGAREAVRALVGRGHERIAIILDSLSIYTMRERLEGAREALVEASLRADDALLSTSGRDPEAAGRALAALLDSDDPPTAVFCGNNRSTIGVIEELCRRDITLGVAGFDDFEMSHLLPRPATIVHYDTRALGRIAAELLFRRIEGDTSEPQTHLLPTRIVGRGLETRARC